MTIGIKVRQDGSVVLSGNGCVIAIMSQAEWSAALATAARESKAPSGKLDVAARS